MQMYLLAVGGYLLSLILFISYDMLTIVNIDVMVGDITKHITQ
jgi:hypothetical protein